MNLLSEFEGQMGKCFFLNKERAYKKDPPSTLLASILKSHVRVTIMIKKSLVSQILLFKCDPDSFVWK